MKDKQKSSKRASKATETADSLRLRKLKAETELAERNLRESKKRWRQCEDCGGHGRFKRSLGRNGSAYYGWTYDKCYSCGGRGGKYYYYED